VAFYIYLFSSVFPEHLLLKLRFSVKLPYVLLKFIRKIIAYSLSSMTDRLLKSGQS
jgi:hypothetical protein